LFEKISQEAWLKRSGSLVEAFRKLGRSVQGVSFGVQNFLIGKKRIFEPRSALPKFGSEI
jgi:hypothetical protein